MNDPVVVHGAEEIAALPAVTVSVKGDGVVDADLSEIGRLTRLEVLYLDGCQELTDAALSHVARLPALREFYTSGKGITDDGLAVLGGSAALAEFGLDAPVTGEGFRHLRGLPALAEIHLPAFPNGTRAGVTALAELPAVRKICFYGVKNLDDSWLETLEGSTSLRELVLMGCKGATEEGLAALRARRPDVSVEVM